jgi:hypothetical protein
MCAVQVPPTRVSWRSDIAVGKLKVFASLTGMLSSSKVQLLQQENLQAKNKTGRGREKLAGLFT